MAAITVANMRRGVLLHKLILLEVCRLGPPWLIPARGPSRLTQTLLAQLLIGGWQSFNMFWSKPTYGWWLSTAAIGLHVSTQLHSVIAWMKLRPFMTERASRIFIGTVILVQPYWILEIYATFAYFNDINGTLFLRLRPIETLFRDPWWVAACAKMLWVLKGHYDMTLREVITISPRFTVMLACMFLSIGFVILDILSAAEVLSDALPVGVNPFWELALVFKCLTDTVILDDFKTVLDKLWTFRRTGLQVASSGPRRDANYQRQPSESSFRPPAGKQGQVTTFQSSPGQDFDFEMQPPASVRST